MISFGFKHSNHTHRLVKSCTPVNISQTHSKINKPHVFFYQNILRFESLGVPPRINFLTNFRTSRKVFHIGLKEKYNATLIESYQFHNTSWQWVNWWAKFTLTWYGCWIKSVPFRERAELRVQYRWSQISHAGSPKGLLILSMRIKRKRIREPILLVVCWCEIHWMHWKLRRFCPHSKATFELIVKIWILDLANIFIQIF